MAKYELRPYQRNAVNAALNSLVERKSEGNPCIVAPTGSGKSIIIAEIATFCVKNYGCRVLVLAHVKELLEQNANKIASLCDIPVGIYSAGLKRKDTDERIIVAGIQSIYKHADSIGEVHLVIVDEVHLINSQNDESMYKSFLTELKAKNPSLRVIGLTATPYRLKGGMICKPENILNFIAYEIGLRELILGGYLCSVTTKAGTDKPDTDSLHIRAGEFVADEVATMMENEQLVRNACREIVDKTKDRNAVLIFCSSIRHCEMVRKQIEQLSRKECAVVTGETSADERAEVIERMRGFEVKTGLFGEKKPPLKYVANVAVLTTGTDIPRIDCVVMLRPTMSPGLMVQMCGRGMRLYDGKKNCLILDYGNNIVRHGTLDNIHVRETDGKVVQKRKNAKECPECGSIVPLSYRKCLDCGHSFEREDIRLRHDTHAAHVGILSGDETQGEFEVMDVIAHAHVKKNSNPGSPHTLKISYMIRPNEFAVEYLCPEHTGFAHNKFVEWWQAHAVDGTPIPQTAAECVELMRYHAVPNPERIKVTYRPGDSFERITWKRPENCGTWQDILADYPELWEKYLGDNGEIDNEEDLPF